MVKRPSVPWGATGRWRDVRKAVTPEQAAGIGRVCLAYNDMEDLLNQIMSVALIGLPDDALHAGVCGTDQKIAIAITACERLKLDKDEMAHIKRVLRPFPSLKEQRDTIVHTKLVDSNHAMGRQVGRGGKVHDVLLTVAATDYVVEMMARTSEDLQGLLKFIAGIRSEIEAKQSGGTTQLPSRYERRLALEAAYDTIRRDNPSPEPPFPEEPQFLLVRVDAPHPKG